MQVSRTHYHPVSNIRKILGRMKAKSLARKTGATKRKARKCSVVDYLLGFWLLQSSGQFSYDCWAAQVSRLTGKTVSGQAICKRMGKGMLAFVEQLLAKSFRHKCTSLYDKGLFSPFGNIYVQDATHFSLPECLSAAFPGSYSRYGEKATAKVQATLNLTKGIFSDFLLTSFRDNDQGDAPRIAGRLKKSDLLIRDLGYFTINSLLKIKQAQAHFLSRYLYGVTVYDSRGQQVDLLKKLKKHGRIDQWVRAGKKEQVLCRLVAVRLDDSVANQRRRKARKDRHHSASHSKEYLELLGYSLYITTVGEDIWNAEEVARAYRCRWYIEIMFKGWKSALGIQMDIPGRYVDTTRARFLFYASLLMVNILVMPVFCSISSTERKARASIIKVCSFIFQRMADFLLAKRLDRLLEQASYYCCYEIRNSRLNAIQRMK